MLKILTFQSQETPIP